MKDMTEEERLFRLDMGFNYWSENKIDILKDLENPANEGKVDRMIDVLQSLQKKASPTLVGGDEFCMF